MFKLFKKNKISKVRKRKHERQRLQNYFNKAGYTFSEATLVKFMSFLSAFIAVLTSAYVVYARDVLAQGTFSIAWTVFWVSISTIPVAYLSSALAFFVVTDLRITARRVALEKVLPEYLHLTAANIRAGMSVDQALWSALKPKFGILAKDIEFVAKQNMVGEKLTKALDDFANKYDSKVLKRTISLINEGIEAGSEIGNLLENVALSIEDIQTRKESMAANVTSNVIFIMFSVLFAAPFLFAVSVQLLRVVHVMGESFLDMNSFGDVINFSLSLSADAVKESDFMIFCFVSLFLSSVMANVIIATIKTGRAGDAIKNIPITAGVAILVFLAANWGLGTVFGGLF